ncbi:hypothetical protein BJX99DRAFT_265526 [Aspergillus californicus]
MATSRKTVLITGCSDDGIGSGLALSFQKRNYHVFATARNTAKMSKLKDLDHVTLLALDVCEKSDIKAAVDAVTEQTDGTLDVLVNNAGQANFMPILDQDIDVNKRLFETNVWGPLALTQSLAPLLIKARGTIAFISSIAGHLNLPYISAYASSKRSLEVYADTLRLELAPFNVRVLTVVTGAVHSQGQAHFDNYCVPDDSLYKPIEGTIGLRAQGQDGYAREDLTKYSETVVGEIVKVKAGKLWCGAGGGTARIVTGLLPGFVLDHVAAQNTGLDILAKQNDG